MGLETPETRRTDIPRPEPLVIPQREPVREADRVPLEVPA